MSFRERDLTIEDLKEGKFNVLITTNLLARGFDNVLSTVVINFDFPSLFDRDIPPEQRDIDLDIYLHRIGRCGRFARNGYAFTIITDEETGQRNIEKLRTTYQVPIEKVDSLELLRAEIEQSAKSSSTD
jgi:ATP-dependent RNA helicase DDX19/DBP5